MRFEKGIAYSKGRPKGSLNKFTTVKNAFTEWFEDIGGTAGLHQFVHKPVDEEMVFDPKNPTVLKKQYIYDIHGNTKFLLGLVSKMLVDKQEHNTNVTVNVLQNIKVNGEEKTYNVGNAKTIGNESKDTPGRYTI